MRIPSVYMPEYRRLNRKLIPANIILLVLALAACLAQIFMPLISLKIDIPEGSVSELIKTLVEEQEEEEDETEASAAQYRYVMADDEEDLSGTDQDEYLDEDTDTDGDAADGKSSSYAATAVEFIDKIDSYFGYLPAFSFTVSFSPLSLVTSPKDDIEAFAEWFAGLFPTGEEMDELAVDVFSPMIAGLVNTEIILMMNNNRLNTKFTKIYERTEEDITAVFTDLALGNPADARTAFNSYILKVGRYILFGVPGRAEDADDSDVDYDALFDEVDAMTLTDEQQEALDELVSGYEDILDEVITAGETDGDESSFSMERAIAGFFDYELSGYIAIGAELTADITEFLTDPNAFVQTWLKETLEDTGVAGMLEDMGWKFDAIMITLFIVFCAFPAALWAIMALSALTHIFRKNKKVAMWYTKLVCIWPCILWYILPLVLVSTAASLSAISISVMSSGLVTGICYLLMWVVSIFMCFPTKRKLRRLKREIKACR